jgi:MFS family permease
VQPLFLKLTSVFSKPQNSIISLNRRESACSPISVSLISDFFGDNQRGTATGIFHWGVYFGYGLSYAVGVYVTASNMFGLGWRMCYLMAGIPGFSKFNNLVCFLFMTKVRPGIVGLSEFNNLACFIFVGKHRGMEVRAGIPGLTKFNYQVVFF